MSRLSHESATPMTRRQPAFATFTAAGLYLGSLKANCWHCSRAHERSPPTVRPLASIETARRPMVSRRVAVASAKGGSDVLASVRTTSVFPDVSLVLGLVRPVEFSSRSGVTRWRTAVDGLAAGAK